MSKKSVMFLIALVTVLSMVLTSCGTTATTAAPVPTQAQDTAAPAATATSAPKKFTIGISNPFISSEYRTQMIAELQEVNKEYMD